MSMNMTASLNVPQMSRANAIQFRASAIQMIRIIEDAYQLDTVLVPPRNARRAKTAVERRLDRKLKVGE